MKKVYRSRTDRKLAGVCAGIAKYFNLDANIVRVICIAAAVISMGAAILAYIACVMIIPEENNTIIDSQ